MIESKLTALCTSVYKAVYWYVLFYSEWMYSKSGNGGKGIVVTPRLLTTRSVGKADHSKSHGKWQEWKLI